MSRSSHPRKHIGRLGHARNGRGRALRLEWLEGRRLLSANVVTYHNDLVSSGVNAAETQLTPGNVAAATFAKQFSTSVDGQVYAQPLYVSGVNVTAGPSPGIHNMVYVATEHDSLYAIDGDSGNLQWKLSFINPAAGVTTVPNGEVNSADITPEIGITGTPAIDLASKSLYVVVKTKEIINNDNANPHYVQRLHKIDIESGADTSVVIADTTRNTGSGAYTYNSGPYVVGNGDGNILVSGQRRIYFNSLRQMFRPGTVLSNGHVYLASASHGDNGPYHGWLLGYDAATLQLTGALNTTPNGGLGGIWQGGGITTIDPQGFFYFETGNGTFNQTPSNFNAQGFPIDGNYGDSFVKVALDPTTTPANQNVNGWGFKVVDFFTPFNEQALDNADADLGSGAPIVLPDSVGSAAHPHLLLGSGKEGKLYLLDRDNLGHYDGATDHVVQEQANAVNGVLSTPAFFQTTPSLVTIYYVGGYGDVAKTFTISNGVLSTAPTSQSGQGNYGFPGSTPSISSNGTNNAIVWTLDRGTNQLRAHNAAGFNQLLYTSGQAGGNRDQLGSVVKFTVPTVANGRVYVGTSNALVVYGPPTPPSTLPADPTNLVAVASFASQIDLMWQENATNEALYKIDRSPDGVGNWVQIGTVGVNFNTYSDTTVLPLTTYYYRVRANNLLGDSGYSNVASATTTSNPSVGSGDGLLGDYYSNTDFTGTHLARVDTTVNFDWGTGAPDASIGADTFSVRWTGLIQATFGETYTFYTQSDDGVRLFINNQTIVDNWTDHSSTENSGSINLAAGQTYGIRMEFYDNGGGALAQLRWSSPSTPKQVVPQSQLFSGVAPTAPSLLAAVAASGTQVNLSWTDNSANETGFKIERKQGAGGTYVQVGLVGPNVNTFMDGGLLAETLYYYRVKAANFRSDSAYSNEVSISTPIPPVTPSDGHATSITHTKAVLVWQDNSNNEDAFRIFRKKGSDGAFIIVATLPANSTTFTDASLTPNTFYDYHIQAGNIAGYSDFTGVTLTTLPNTLPVALGDGYSVTTGSALNTADTPENLVGAAAVWKYLDNGSNQGVAWRNPGFNDAAWAQGPAQLGYGDGDEATVVGYGGDANNKFTTTYFRRAFSVSDPAHLYALTVDLIRDDGAIVHLNGVEVVRTNMPGLLGDNSVSSSTFADVTVAGADESALNTFTVDPRLLVEGTNVLAVEIHQANLTSSDISFDLRMNAMRQTGSVLHNDFDPDGDTIAPSLAVATPHGTLNFRPDGTFNYVPDAGFAGADGFTYRVNDGFDDSLPAAVSIQVLPLVYNVANTLDGGLGSLRQAILDVNAAVGKAHQITFAIPGAAPHVIQPAAALPALTQPTAIGVAAGDVVNVGGNSAFGLPTFVSLTKVGAGTLVLGGSAAAVSGTSLAIDDGLVQLSDTVQHVVVLDSLTTSGPGALDLANGRLIVHATPATRDAVLADIAAQIASGAAGLAWNGPGIHSSTAATDGAHLTAVGAMLNDNGQGGSFYASFGGQLVSANDILVRYTYYGDADLNGADDGTDYALIDNGFNSGLAGWLNGDFNYSGAVDGTDYALIDNAFNGQGGPLAAFGPVPRAAHPAGTEKDSPMSVGLPSASTAAGQRNALEGLAIDDELLDVLVSSPVRRRRGR